MRILLLLIAFTVSYVVIFLRLSSFIAKQTVPYTIARTIPAQVTTGSPVRLIIPAINVDAAIQEVGVTTKGEMASPDITNDVGWFNLGPLPGDVGSAVIAGHVDDVTGQAAVFADLNRLKNGDQVIVKDSLGKSIVFIVKDSLQLNPGYADTVFDPTDKPHLNLVTCDGIWDKSKKSYSKRLVVFTDIASL